MEIKNGGHAMKKRFVVFYLVLAGAFLFQPAFLQASAPKSGGNLIYATGTDATTLDPQFVTDVPTSRVVMWVHQTLVYPDLKGNMQPVLAESWTVSDDKLTWTFKLRKGVKFQDGTPFNAEAVKFTFDRINDPQIASPRKSSAVVVKEVQVIDDYTVRFVTKEPFAPFLAQLSAYNLAILSPTQAKKLGKKYGEQPAGTGPFKLEKWVPGEKMVFVRNENYWGDKPYLERIEVRVVPEDSARVMMLLSGDVDVIASVPPVMLDRLNQSKDVNILKQTGFRTIYIGMNNKVKPFDNPAVRKALTHAINPEAIVKGVLAGVGTLGGAFESPVIAGADKNLPLYEYNPAQAKKLLAEAGYPDGFETELYTPTGRYLMDRQVAEAVQAQLKEVGVKAKIQTPDWGTLISLLNKYDQVPMFLMGKGSPTGDLDFTLALTTQCGGKMNHFSYCNQEVDKLIKLQRGTVNVEERYKVLDQIQEIFYDEAPSVTLYYEDQIFGQRANVHGVEVNPNEFIDFFKAWKE
jgi:peptide/nickel transport system substrate-binding protein